MIYPHRMTNFIFIAQGGPGDVRGAPVSRHRPQDPKLAAPDNRGMPGVPGTRERASRAGGQHDASARR